MSKNHAKSHQEKSELKKFFHSAIRKSSTREMLREFKKLESCCDDKELGFECWALACELQIGGGKPEDVLSFGKRALNVLISDDNCEMPCFSTTKGLNVLKLNQDAEITTPKTHGKLLLISSTLNMLGLACCELKRLGECLSYLNWANRNLTKLEEDACSCPSCILQLLLVNQMGLFKLKMMHLGRRDEAAAHMRKILEIKEKTLEEGCIELGQANKDVYYGYIESDDYEKALPHCLKALQIYAKHLGRDDAKEVARIRRDLSGIYCELGEYEKALEQNQLSQVVLRSMDRGSEFLKSEIQKGMILIELGRYDEAIDVLKAVASQDNAQGGERATALITSARALCNLGKLVEAKKCMETGQKILERKGISPAFVADGFQNLSILYEKMDDFETAISLSRRVLSIPGLPQQLLVDGYKRVVTLISHSNMGIQGIPYLEDVVNILKERFGPQNLDVGYAYSNLGEAYMSLDRPEAAAKSLKCAKAIMDVFLGPNHTDSLKTSQVLYLAYLNMGRNDLAIESQEKMVESLKGLGPSEVDHLSAAIRLLDLMKVNAASAVGESSTSALSQSEGCENHAERIPYVENVI